MRKVLLWQFFLISLFNTGCNLGPHYCPPVMDIPCEWHSPVSENMQNGSSECFQWWESLNDPTLCSLIQRAGQQNLDLFIAASRILQVRLERKGKISELYPRIDGSATYGHVYYSKDALVNGLLATAIPEDQLSSSVKRNVDFFELGFDAEWEIDLFGVKAHEISSLQAKIESSEESLCDLWITLSAEIARNYVELRGLQQRLKLICESIESQAQAVELINRLNSAGMSNIITLKEAEEQLNSISSQKPLIELSIEKTIHHLSILLGSNPADLFCELCESGALPCIPDCIPIGLPSDLLRRRPDIRRAERELAAATELVGSAVASLFPRLSLYGFIGDISTHLPSLFESTSHTWFAGPQLLMPILNSRLIEQDIKFNKIKTQQACYEYQKTVLNALEETENAIAAFHYGLERNCFLLNAQQASLESYQLTSQLYEKGMKDYLAVLAANRSFISAEEVLIQSQMDILFNYIALYKSLGGGWEPSDCCPEDVCLN